MSLYPKSVLAVLHLMWFASGSTVIVTFLRYMLARWSVPICVVIVSAAVILKVLGAVLDFFTWLNFLVINLALYSCGLFLYILMSFLSVLTLLGSHGVAPLVYPIFSSIIIFGNLSFFGVTVKFLPLIGQKMIAFFAGFIGWSSSRYTYIIGTLRGSS